MKVKAEGLVNTIEALGLKRWVDKELTPHQMDEIRKAAAGFGEIDLSVYSDTFSFFMSAAYEVYTRKSSSEIQKVKDKLDSCIEPDSVSSAVCVLASALNAVAQEPSVGSIEHDLASMPLNWASCKKYINTGLAAYVPSVSGTIDPLSVIITQMESLIALLPQVRSRIDKANPSAFQKATTYVAWNALRGVTSWWLWELREIRQKDDDEAFEANVSEEQ